jgi:putative ABC transport system permease protein
VADVRQGDLQDRAPNTVYMSPLGNLGTDLSLVIRTGLPVSAVVPAIRKAVAQVNPNIPVAIRPMSDFVAAATVQRRFQILLLISFAAVAVLLAAVGIHGTLSYSVNQRYRESEYGWRWGRRRATCERSCCARRSRRSCSAWLPDSAAPWS